MGAAGGVAIGASADSAIGFPDGGLLTGLGADIDCLKVATDMGNILTEDNYTTPDRVRYFGDPISAFGFQPKTIMPSFKQRWRNSAHSYAGSQIAGKVETHDTMKNMLEPSPEDSQADVITY